MKDRKGYFKQYYQKNKEKFSEYNKQWREDNPDYQKQWREEHKAKLSEYGKKRNMTPERRAYLSEYEKKRIMTPERRACKMVSSYSKNDIKYNRGESTLTVQWIVENIFSQPCHYCGKTGWMEIGCDRIDNNRPHTPDNVVPCCKACNLKRGTKEYEEFKNISLGSGGII